jgi:hypothetical protein
MSRPPQKGRVRRHSRHAIRLLLLRPLSPVTGCAAVKDCS